MIFQDLIGYLHDDILVKVDRASMAASLEARAPLLDHRLVEFMWRLPLSFRIRDGRGKWLLRRIVDRHVPRALVERPKTGFGLPIGAWLRGPLRDWAEPLVAPAALGRRRLRRPRRRRRVAAASRRRGRGAAAVAGPDVPGLASALGLRDPAVTSLSVLVPVYNEEYLVAESLGRLEVLGDSPHLDQGRGHRRRRLLDR